MPIQQYLRLLKDGWWIIAAMLLISSGVALAYSYSLPPVYEVTATFVVNPTTRIADTYDQLYSIDTLAGRTSLATTYANVLKSRAIAETAANSLQLLPAELAKCEVNAVVLPDSSVISLRVQGPSAVTAANLANAIGNAGLDYIKSLQEIYELQALDSASIEPEPISPNHLIDTTLGVIIGLVGGVVFLILRQQLTLPVSEPIIPAKVPSSSKVEATS